MRALDDRLRQRLLADGQRSRTDGIHGGLPILLSGGQLTAAESQMVRLAIIPA
jgi:hypothetical protein